MTQTTDLLPESDWPMAEPEWEPELSERDWTKVVFKALMLAWSVWLTWGAGHFLAESWSAMRVGAVLIYWAAGMVALAVLMPATRWLVRQWSPTT